jgi:hypothetical protein
MSDTHEKCDRDLPEFGYLYFDGYVAVCGSPYLDLLATYISRQIGTPTPLSQRNNKSDLSLNLGPDLGNTVAM